MQKLTILSVLISCGLFATACSSSTSGGGNTFSCDEMETAGTTTVHSCSEYDNLPDADQSTIAAECTAAMGTAGSGCSTDNSLGSCTITSGGFSYSTFYYSDGTETADDASTSCMDSSGTWKAN